MKSDDLVGVFMMAMCLFCAFGIYLHVSGVGIKYVDNTGKICGCLTDRYTADMLQCERNDRWEVIKVSECL